MEPIMELRNITFSYNGRNPVFKNVNMRLEGNGVHFVVGPNGAGKTTLLKIIGLLYRPTGGELRLWNENPWKDGDLLTRLRRKIVYVHEKPILLRGNVLQNLLYPLTKIRGIDEKEALSRVKKISDYMGINDLLQRDVRSLSAGQAHLIAVARAVSLNPDILLLDEPFSHLDTEKKKLLAAMIREEGSKKLVIIATHDTYLASKIGDRFIILENGRVETLDRIDLTMI